MKHYLAYILLTLSLLIISGCGNSPIVIKQEYIDKPFDKVQNKSQHVFIESVSIPDSLILKWEFDAHGNFGHIPLSFFGNRICIGDLSGRMFAADFDTGDSEGMQKHKDGTILTPPIFSDSLMIYAVSIQNKNQSLLIFYDISEGFVKEEIEVKGKITSSLLPADTTFWSITQNGNLYEYSYNGNEIKNIDLNRETNSNLLSYNDQLICLTNKGDIVFITPSGKSKTKTFSISDMAFGSGTVYKDMLFAGNDDGCVYQFDLKAKELRFSYQTSGRITAKPVIENDVLYVGNLMGDFYALSSDTLKKLWSVSTEGIFNTPPLVFENCIVVTDMAFAMHVFNKKDGKRLKTYPFETKLNIHPFYKNNTLIIGLRRGILRAYEWNAK